MPNYSRMTFDMKLSKALGEGFGKTYQLPYISEDLGMCECCQSMTGELVSGGLLSIIPPGELRKLGVKIEAMWHHNIRLCDICGLVFYGKFHGYQNKAQAKRLLVAEQGYKISHARKEVDERENFMEVYRERVEKAQSELEALQSTVDEVELEIGKRYPQVDYDATVTNIKRTGKYTYTLKLMKENTNNG